MDSLSQFIAAGAVGLLTGGLGCYIAFIRLQEGFKHHLTNFDSHVNTCNEKNKKLETVLEEFHDFLGDTRVETAKSNDLMQYLKEESHRTRDRLHQIEARVMRLTEKFAPIKD